MKYNTKASAYRNKLSNITQDVIRGKVDIIYVSTNTAVVVRVK